MLNGADGSVCFEEEPTAPTNSDFGYHLDGIDTTGAITFRWNLNGYAGGGGGTGTGPSGNLWIASTFGNWIQSCASDGYPSAILLGLGNFPISQMPDGLVAAGIASPGDGLAYVAVGTIPGLPSGILAYDPNDATITDSAVEGEFYYINACATFPTSSAVQNIAAGADGNIWFSQNSWLASNGNPAQPTFIGVLAVQRIQATLTDNSHGSVNPGQTVHFTLNVTGGPDTPTSMLADVLLPRGLSYVANSSNSSNAKVLSDGELEFTIDGTKSGQVSFDATVADKNHLPLNSPSLPTEVFLSGRWPDGRTPHAIASDSLNVSFTSFLNIDIQPQLPIPGQVQAGQTFVATINTLSDSTYSVEFRARPARRCTTSRRELNFRICQLSASRSAARREAAEQVRHN